MSDCRYYQKVKAGSAACRRMIFKGSSCCESCEHQPDVLVGGGKADMEVKVMSDLKCGKCGKHYKHPKRLATHEAGCSGETPSPGSRGRQGGGKGEPGVGPARKAVMAKGPDDLFTIRIRPEKTMGEYLRAYPGLEEVIISHVQAQA